MSGFAPEVLDNLIGTALSLRASDIHIEPSLETYTVRFRVDGFLHHHTLLELSIGGSIIARIKVLAHADIAESRLPQDGKFRFTFQKGTFDIRVATFPCIYGEKVVLRLLYSSEKALSLDSLGLPVDIYKKIQELAQSSTGFILATGPTGSGKTTLLHALLSSTASPHKQSMTLEDPVEYTIEGVTQTTINPSLGFTFQAGLRSLLRLDPDILMVGEMRDAETADVALKAALTGHLVFSTLHTFDAPSALLRLLDMGLDPYVLSATVTGIIAQRLARRLCTSCKRVAKLSAEEEARATALKLSINSVYKSEGCLECKGTGVKGRIGIFQLLIPSNSLRSILYKKPDYTFISRIASKDGMRSLLADGLLKVEEGIISFAELIRVCF